MIELTVTMVVSGLLAVVLFTAIVGLQRSEEYTGQDSRALAELRVAVDRLSRELREARRVYASSDMSIKFWRDDDRDNQQDPAERVTWSLATSGSGGRLLRTTDATPTEPSVVASEVVVSPAFTATPVPPDTARVDVVLHADVNQASAPSQRTVRTAIRLRNAAG